MSLVKIPTHFSCCSQAVRHCQAHCGDRICYIIWYLHPDGLQSHGWMWISTWFAVHSKCHLSIAGLGLVAGLWTFKKPSGG